MRQIAKLRYEISVVKSPNCKSEVGPYLLDLGNAAYEEERLPHQALLEAHPPLPPPYRRTLCRTGP
jgi:hypothetical protein